MVQNETLVFIESCHFVSSLAEWTTHIHCFLVLSPKFSGDIVWFPANHGFCGNALFSYSALCLSVLYPRLWLLGFHTFFIFDFSCLCSLLPSWTTMVEGVFPLQGTSFLLPYCSFLLSNPDILPFLLFYTKAAIFISKLHEYEFVFFVSLLYGLTSWVVVHKHTKAAIFISNAAPMWLKYIVHF